MVKPERYLRSRVSFENESLLFRDAFSRCYTENRRFAAIIAAVDIHSAATSVRRAQCDRKVPPRADTRNHVESDSTMGSTNNPRRVNCGRLESKNPPVLAEYPCPLPRATWTFQRKVSKHTVQPRYRVCRSILRGFVFKLFIFGSYRLRPKHLRRIIYLPFVLFPSRATRVAFYNGRSPRSVFRAVSFRRAVSGKKNSWTKNYRSYKK